jgi:thioredoxin-dependent peroxiredoxin
MLAPGDKAPDFRLLDAAGTKVGLKDLRGQRVILYAYPAAMTAGCTKQACDFRDNLAVFAGSNITVLGISPDSPEKLAKFVARDQLPFTLLSDPDHSVLEKYGAWGEKKLYGKTVVGVKRSTFLISPEGRIELAMYNVKATGHVAKVIRDLGLS